MKGVRKRGQLPETFGTHYDQSEVAVRDRQVNEVTRCLIHHFQLLFWNIFLSVSYVLHCACRLLNLTRHTIEIKIMLPRWLSGKGSTCQYRDCRRHELIPCLERSPGGGNSNPLQYSCQENSRTEQPGGLQSMGSQRVRHDQETNTFTFFFLTLSDIFSSLKIE